MPMPKATVDEDRQPELHKNQIWVAGQIFALQPKPEAGGVNGAAHVQFQRSVTRRHTRHRAATSCWIKVVHDLDQIAGL